MMSNPAMEKKVQGLIRKVLMAARREIGKSIPFKDGDPRQAYKAVKTSVYRQILGGNVSILKKKSAAKFSAYEPPRTLNPAKPGGNRKARSQRTWDLVHYAGPDRGFVLRFLNAGTQVRGVKFVYDEDRQATKWNRHPNTGNRGRIKSRGFFNSTSQRALNRAADQLVKLIDDLIKQETS
jgi:hypothetical protein